MVSHLLLDVDMKFEELLTDLQTRASEYGIHIRSKELAVDKPGEFDGFTITLHPGYDLQSRCFYLAHAFGSIAQWSVNYGEARGIFDSLRDAKKAKSTDPHVFRRALREYLAFEETSSDHAVWLLDDLDHHWAIEPYTLFFRADLESMAQFHETGVAPVWYKFFAYWKEKVRSGQLTVIPFKPRPIPEFKPVRIPLQEVLQEVDGQP